MGLLENARASGEAKAFEDVGFTKEAFLGAALRAGAGGLMRGLGKGLGWATGWKTLSPLGKAATVGGGLGSAGLYGGAKMMESAEKAQGTANRLAAPQYYGMGY